NMRQIDAAVNQWALETHQTTGAAAPSLTSDLTPYIKLNSANSIPGCPAGGSYTVGTVGQAPQVTCNLGNTVTPGHYEP
ncbi:MAG TPA: hypothetical protein VH251_12325, partial [Verrucomicrobiae bacterium]|nr:hypothetical protein [Verrucomicrobiae bacterium]